ncbi:MAG: DUF2550 domain-containing protein [Actinomycetota bacterium]|nr:DUF2550 domain-containing protein [Actinomycetota bacterium]
MQVVEMVALLVLVVLLAVLVAIGIRRVQLLRRGGTQVVLRRLPAPPGRGWRHGVVRYREEYLVFFRVSSLRSGADRSVPRRSLVVLERRQPEASERELVPARATVIRFRDEAGEAEVALDAGALTAFLSWVESSPPGRAERTRR